MGARLRWIRRTVAAAFLVGLAFAFVDFRHLAPERLGHALASVQFVPSALSLLTGASFSIACLVVLAATLAVGRVYCGAICPLGLLQDVIRRVSRLLNQAPPFLKYAPARSWIRHGFLWATALAIVAGWGGLALAVLDPYSNFGRLFSALVRPVVTLANNALVHAFPSLASHGWYRVDVVWASLGVISVALTVLVVIGVMSALRGRLYCNTVCPVGTLLGMLSRRAAYRLSINSRRCKRCAECLKVCRAQCIDLRTRQIDASRCVACFDCLSVCKEAALAYEYSWKKPQPEVDTAPAVPEPSTNFSAGRRAFVSNSLTSILSALGGLTLLARGGGGEGAEPARPQRHRGNHGEGHGGEHSGKRHREHHDAGPICPPGSGSREAFLSRCTACQLCISACPTRVLQPAFLEYGIAGLMKPRFDLAVAFCNFDCTRCGDVCPTGAIDALALPEKQVTRVGVAHFDRRLCIVDQNGTDCAACSEHCPTKAVHTVPFRENLRLPEVDESLCIGCGACEFACPVQPTKAITVSPKLVHERASKAREEKASTPVPTNDFPF
ncbi:4Fe-4S ferredoxin [Opitutaceae bacterium EW11]|nr:4Fe-4S ferredoxin [Opitutaceae bacterium EW11]